MARALIAAPAYALDHPRLAVRLAQTLANSGHDVVTLGTGSGPAPPGVRALKPEPLRVGLRRIGGCRRVAAEARRSQYDIIVAGGVESWITLVALRPVHGARVVADLIEDYPATVARHFRSRVCKAVAEAVVRQLIRFLSWLSHGVLLSREALGDQVAASTSTFFLPNFVPLGTTISEPAQRSEQEPFEIVHAGLFIAERGAGVIAPAMRELLTGSRAPVRLRQFGAPLDDAALHATAELEELSRVDSRFEFEMHDWLPYSDLMSEVRSAHVGVILFQPWSANLRNPMPNKAFDYMASGLAVLAPAWAGDFAAMLEKEQAAVLVDTSNASAVAAALASLEASEEGRLGVARRGSYAVASRWSMQALQPALDGFIQTV